MAVNLRPGCFPSKEVLTDFTFHEREREYFVHACSDVSSTNTYLGSPSAIWSLTFSRTKIQANIVPPRSFNSPPLPARFRLLVPFSCLSPSSISTG